MPTQKPSGVWSLSSHSIALAIDGVDPLGWGIQSAGRGNEHSHRQLLRAAHYRTTRAPARRGASASLARRGSDNGACGNAAISTVRHGSCPLGRLVRAFLLVGMRDRGDGRRRAATARVRRLSRVRRTRVSRAKQSRGRAGVCARSARARSAASSAAQSSGCSRRARESTSSRRRGATSAASASDAARRARAACRRASAQRATPRG